MVRDLLIGLLSNLASKFDSLAYEFEFPLQLSLQEYDQQDNTPDSHLLDILRGDTGLLNTSRSSHRRGPGSLDVFEGVVLLSGLLDKGVQSGLTGLGVPWSWSPGREHLLDFLEGLVAGLRVCEEELDCCKNTHDAEDDEHAVLDVLKARRDIKTLIYVSKPMTVKQAFEGGAMDRKHLGDRAETHCIMRHQVDASDHDGFLRDQLTRAKLKSQLPSAAMDMPTARVSRDQTSAA